MTDYTQAQAADFRRRMAEIKKSQAVLEAQLIRFKALMVSGQRVPDEESAAYDVARYEHEEAMKALGTDMGMDMSHIDAERAQREAQIAAFQNQPPEEMVARASALLNQWENEDYGVPLTGNRRAGGLS